MLLVCSYPKTNLTKPYLLITRRKKVEGLCLQFKVVTICNVRHETIEQNS